jgi:ssDNA-binding Zn-finger/Zn-ribbon topoisomerase 1
MKRTASAIWNGDLKTGKARSRHREEQFLRECGPRCENEMVLRTAKKGKEAGSQFWGCSTYPGCRYTLRLAEAA